MSLTKAKIKVERIITTTDGVEYKLFKNNKGWAIRVFDIDAKEVVTLVNYPDKEMAQKEFNKIIEKDL